MKCLQIYKFMNYAPVLFDKRTQSLLQHVFAGNVKNGM